MSFQNVHILKIQPLFQKLSRIGENDDDETCANFIRQNTQQKAQKKKDKERGPKCEPKEQNQKRVIKGQRNKSCFKTPTSCKKHIKKKKG